MKWLKYPVLKMLLPYLAGIFVSYFFITIGLNPLIFFSFCFLLLIFAIALRFLFPLRGQQFALLFLCLAFFLFAVIQTNVRYYPPHYAKVKNMVQNSDFFTVQISENIVDKEKSVKAIVNLLSDRDGNPLRTNAVLYLQKCSKASSLRPGDKLIVHTKFNDFSPPQNPHAFDNQKYMRLKGIFFTAYASSQQWEYLSHSPIHPLRTCASYAQHHFSALFARNGLQGEEYAVITAVLLGNDETMDADLKAHFAAAGVSHILCVSGMHVGIIFMIINFILKPFDNFPRLRILKAIILLLLIWTYAHITGLAPSVKRAATMFTFVSLGSLLHRPTSIYHSLFASIFILLLINPLLIFEVGFQMSYLAVFGIVIIQPQLTRLWTPKYKIVNYFWELATVSVAAQLTTFPLSLFYFGQFPNYFLLSNLSVISLSFLIVMTGIVLLVFSWVPPLSRLIGVLLTYEIRLLNTIVKGIESLPGSVTDNISITVLQMMLIYGIIIAIFLYLNKKSFLLKTLALSTFLALGITFFFDKFFSKNTNQLTFYSIDKMSAVECNAGTCGVLLLDSTAQNNLNAYEFNIHNHVRKQHIENMIVPLDTIAYSCPTLAKKGNFLRFDKHTVFFLSGREWLYPMPQPIQVDVVCIQHNPRIPMGKLLQTVQFREMLIDGSNSRYWEQRWIDSCQAYRIPYHSTRRNGYFSL